MFCPKCGKEKIDDRIFCGECGTHLIKSPTKEQLPPKCGKEKPADKQFCGECGTPLIRSPTKEQVPTKSKNNIFIIGLIVFFIIFVAIFFNPMGYLKTNPSPQKTIITPIPTPNNQFKVNEPATDGNLRITVIRSYDYAGSSNNLFSPNTKWVTKYIVLKLENLRSDRVIHILSADFRLLEGNIEYSNGAFRDGDSIKFDLQPSQREQVELGYAFADGTDLSTFNKLKFDFSGSGGNTGSKIVYFNL